MSSDDTDLISKSKIQSKASHSGMSEDAVALKNSKTKLANDALKQEKFKQDQLKMEKFREEMLRQEKLRQELENKELQRQQGIKQEQLKNQQQIQQQQLKKQQHLNQLKLKLAAEKRVVEEQKLLEQVRIESERVAQQKIEKEKLRQEKLMSERLEKKRIEREQQQQNVLAAQAFEAQPLVIDSTPELEKQPQSKSAFFGIADKLRSSLKAVEDTVAVKKAPELIIEESVPQPKVDIVAPVNSVKEPMKNARSLQLCGNIEDQDYNENLDGVRYEPEDYVMSSVLYYVDQTKRSSAIIRLKFDDIVIVIDYALNTIYCNVPLLSTKFDKFCSKPSMPNVDVYQLQFEEVRAERRNTKSVGNSIEAFVWTCTLLTAKGRLPSYTDTSRSIGIKQDADFSKLESIPCLDQIIAELKENPCKLMEVSPQLGIPQKYVISFYNAAANLNFLEFNMPQKVTKPKKSSSGFFSFKK